MKLVRRAHRVPRDPLYLRVYLTGLMSKALAALARALTPLLDDGVATWRSRGGGGLPVAAR